MTYKKDDQERWEKFLGLNVLRQTAEDILRMPRLLENLQKEANDLLDFICSPLFEMYCDACDMPYNLLRGAMWELTEKAEFDDILKLPKWTKLIDEEAKRIAPSKKAEIALYERVIDFLKIRVRGLKKECE